VHSNLCTDLFDTCVGTLMSILPELMHSFACITLNGFHCQHEVTLYADWKIYGVEFINTHADKYQCTPNRKDCTQTIVRYQESDDEEDTE